MSIFKTYCFSIFKSARMASVLILLSVIPFVALAKKGDETIDAVVKFVVNEKQVYEGQSVIVDLVLCGSNNDIAGISRLTAPDFDGIGWREVSLDRNTVSSYSNEKSKKMESAIPIARYLINAVMAGDYKINPGKIVAEVYTGETVIDPFWGTRYRKKISVPIETELLKLKVNNIPNQVRGKKIPLGDFNANWNLPPGEIVPNQDGIVILNIEGYGNLGDTDFSYLKDALPEDLKFVGMTPEVNVVVKNGRVYSIAQLIFTFNATKAGKYNLRPVDLLFFSARDKKNNKVSVIPIEIEIQSGKKVNKPMRFEQI